MRVEKFKLIFPNGEVYETTQIAYFTVYPKLEKMSKESYRAIVALATSNTALPPQLKNFLSTEVKRPIVDKDSGQFCQPDYKKIVLWHNAERKKEALSSVPNKPGLQPQAGFIGF